jgi:hypothetical protein
MVRTVRTEYSIHYSVLGVTDQSRHLLQVSLTYSNVS